MKHHHLGSLLMASVVLLHGLTPTTAVAEESKAKKKRRAAVQATENVKNQPLTIKDLEAGLDLPCPELDFPGDCPLTEVVEEFRLHWKSSLPRPFDFMPDVVELDLEGIISLEDIMVRDVRFVAGSHTCRDALRIIFDRTSEPKLTFVMQSGHLLITTVAKAESDDCLRTKLYDVTALLPVIVHQPLERQKSQSGKQNAGEESTQVKAGQVQKNGLETVSTAHLIKLIVEQTSPPARWVQVDGEGGAISAYGQYLAIRQTARTHEQIAALLSQLEAVIELGGSPRISAEDVVPHWHPKAVPKVKAPSTGGGFFDLRPEEPSPR